MAPSNGDRKRVASLFRELSRAAAKNQLEKFCGSTAAIRELRITEEFDHEHWLASILVNSKVVSIGFRCHYGTDTGRQLASKKTKRPLDDVTQALARDFVREFCNCVAGAIKRVLADTKELTGEIALGLPNDVKVASVDELEEPEAEIIDCWGVAIGADELVCASHLKVHNWDVFERIETIDMSSLVVSDEGNIEFF